MMGAETQYRVEVWRLISNWIVVSAVTADEAMEIAAREPGVARAIEASPLNYEDDAP
jgi:hypothetical protein